MTAIRRLRALADLAEQSGDPELVAAAADFRRYEREAPAGLTLDDVLGLTARGGAGPWWKQEQRAERDALLRELRQEFFGTLEVNKAAAEIAALANARKCAAAPPRDERDALVDAALETGVKFPARQRLAAVLGISKAD